MRNFGRTPARLLVDPDGIEIEIVAVPGCRAPKGEGPIMLPHAQLHAQLTPPGPISLSHLAIFVTDIGRSLAYYQSVLGMELSDRNGERLTFLHTRHGSGHHVLALIKSEALGLHHYAFEMGTINARQSSCAMPSF